VLPIVLHGVHQSPGPLHLLLKQQALQELHETQKKGEFTSKFLGFEFKKKIYKIKRNGI